MGKIKGWKKIKDTKKYPNTKLWLNKDENSYVQYRNPFKDIHIVNIYVNINPVYNSPSFEAEFKTKDKALTHAINYMKRHPNG